MKNRHCRLANKRLVVHTNYLENPY